MESYKSFLNDFEYKKGTLTVVTGLPGVGKSYFIENEAVNLAKNGVKVFYENCEIASFDLSLEFLSIYNNRDTVTLVKCEDDSVKEEFSKLVEEFPRNLIFGYHTLVSLCKLNEFIEDIKREVIEYSSEVVFLDVPFTNDSDETIRLFRETAKELDVAIILTVHQPALTNDSRSRKDHIYTKIVWDNFIDIKWTEDTLERKLFIEYKVHEWKGRIINKMIRKVGFHLEDISE